MIVWDYSSWNDFNLYEPFELREQSMSKQQNFAISGGYAFDTLDEAVTSASRRAAKNNEDFVIYQAVKKVSPMAPQVNVTDVTISTS